MHKRTASLLLVILCAFAAAMCLRGIDFGYQWDESSVLSWARHSVTTGSLLPPNYIYPSFSHDLLLACLLPELLKHAIGFFSETYTRVALIDLMRSDIFLIRARTVFCLITLLTIPFVYSLVLRWGRRPAEALLAAAIVALSWEGYYHALWVSPNGPMTAFAALTLLLAMRGQIRTAGVAAGLAASCKYPMALLLVPVILAAAPQNKRDTAGARTALAALLTFALTFFLTTPGILFEPLRVWADVMRTAHEYSASFGGYTVAAWSEHLPLMMRYLTGPLLSSYAPAALLFSLLAGVGIVSIWRENSRDAAVFFAFPAIYISYFAGQHVMLVRNYIPILPFMGVLAARGFFFLSGRSKPVKTALVALLFAALGANAFRIIQSAESLTHRRGSETRYARSFAAFTEARPAETFRISEKTARAVLATGAALNSNLKENGTAQWAALYSNEVLDWHRWTANHPGIIRASFGPLDANLDYYPTWEGNPRIVIVSFAEAVRLGVFDAQGK